MRIFKLTWNFNKKLWILLLLMIPTVWGVKSYREYLYKQTDGFSSGVIQFDIPFNPDYEILSLSDEEKGTVDQILQKKYVYLSKGARSYAFVSDDGKHVIKFFKYRYAEPHWTVRYLPSIQPFEYFRQKKINKVSLDTVLSGYKTAYDFDRHGTGLVYIHLNPTSGKHAPIVLQDKIGRSHTIDLDNTRFVLQKRAEELSKVLKDHLETGDVAGAEKILIETLDLYFFHFNQGIYDLGTGLIRNNGMIEDAPIHFDVGKMTLDPRIRDPEFQYGVMMRLIENGDKWLSEYFPQYQKELREALSKRVAELYAKENF